MIPGEYILLAGDDAGLTLNPGAPVTEVAVAHHGDRPVQVGSHFHFFEVNTALRFHRAQAYGKRLAIAAGTAVRFEPGDIKTVPLIPYGGAREVHGHRGLVNGPLLSDAPVDGGGVGKVADASDSMNLEVVDSVPGGARL